MESDIKIVACPGAKEFSKEIIKHLRKIDPKADLVDCEFFKFKNSEVKTVLNEPVRGSDIYIIQDVANKETGSVQDNLMTLFCTIDSCMHASCNEVNLIIPTFPYARQHKKTRREGLTASMICHFFEFLGVKRVITLDIHSREIQNSFSRTIMENLHASYQIVKEMIKRKVPIEDITIVAPDAGSTTRNTFFANALHTPLAIMYKERDYSRTSESADKNNITLMKLIGDAGDKNIIICDDMIDTGSTILRASKYLKKEGAKDIYIICSLPFFNSPAIDDFDKAVEDGVIKGVFGTNAVYNPLLWKRPWFYKVDISKLFADVIFRINEEISLSELLDGVEEIENLLKENKY